MISVENCQIGRMFKHKNATKMQNCGFRNWARSHELAIKLSLVGIKVLNHP